MQQWEYLTRDIQYIPLGDAELDLLGMEGWELVNFVIDGGADPVTFLYAFKRPRV